MKQLRSFILLLCPLLLVTSTAAQTYREEDVRFESQDAVLSGTLTLPELATPAPALVLISGSGPQDRNESLPEITSIEPFRLIAEHLGRSGIAVLRYDDRGHGQSTGKFGSATSADFAEDVEAALAYLRSRQDIDHDAVGLLGHSEGGMIAPMVAARNPELVAFVIALAGTAVPGYYILLDQLDHELTKPGLPDADRRAAYERQKTSLDLAVKQDWAGLERYLREQHAVMPAEQQSALGEREQFVSQGLAFYKGWLHFFVTHNPAEDWQQVHVPVLALYGDKDVQVSSELNAPALEQALSKAGNTDVTVMRFSTANHLFQQAETGEPDEYGTLKPEFIPELLPTISDWILRRVRP